MVPAETLRTLLQSARRIAVVGLADEPSRPAWGVARYLQEAGYAIVPVHPRAETVHGAQGFPSVAEAAASGPIDIVDLFVRGERVGAMVDDIVAARPKVAWMQLGVTNGEAAERLERAGLVVVQDRCLKIEHLRLLG